MASFDDNIRGIAEHVLSSIKESFIENNNNRTGSDDSSSIPTFSSMSSSSYEAFMGFVHAIDWTERWIQSMIFTEIVVCIAAVVTRKNQILQAVLFVTIS